MLFAVIAVLAVAGTGLVVGRLVGLSPIPSYLLAGVLAGPGGLGWLAHSESLDQLAEVGVALRSSASASSCRSSACANGSAAW